MTCRSTTSIAISTIATSRARTGSRKPFLDATSATGLRRNFAPMGSALLWSPFYAIADAGVRVARMFGSAIPADGFSRPYIAAITYGSALYGFLAIVLSAMAARRLVGGGATSLAAVWLGTPLLFYMYVAPGFSHACSAFAVAAFVFTWLHVRRSWTPSGVVALGAARRAHGHGARAGSVHRYRPCHRLRRHKCARS